MTKHNLTLLTKQERDDIDLDKRAAMLIHQVKNGQVTKQFVKSELARVEDPKTYNKFKFYLNKYRVMK